MAHIGVFCPSVPGHLNPISCLARELQTRGHRVTTFQPPELEEAVRRNGLDYQPIGESVFPPGAVSAHYARQGTLQGLAALSATPSPIGREEAGCCWQRRRRRFAGPALTCYW
jgi:zeaxanthin glucosyltransferase